MRSSFLARLLMAIVAARKTAIVTLEPQGTKMTMRIAAALAIVLGLAASASAQTPYVPYLVKAFGDDAQMRPVGASGDLVFVNVYQPLADSAVWTSTGTAASTQPIVGTVPGLPLAVLDGSLVYAPDDGIWSTDGTTAGTFRLSSIPVDLPGPTHGGASLAVGRWNTGLGQELLRTDGTPEGTGAVRPEGVTLDVAVTGPGSSFRDGFAFVSEGQSARGFWTMDATGAATFVPFDGGCFRAAGSETRLFLSCSGPGGSGLWVSDGTSAGTTFLKEVSLGFFADVEGTLFFDGYSGGSSATALWMSDGTVAGTRRLSEVAPLPVDLTTRMLTVSGGILYFAGTTAATGTELWRTDGTAAGTFMVRDIEPGPGSGLDVWVQQSIATGSGGLLFKAFTSATGFELWRTDGTTAGTTALPEIRPGPASAAPTSFQQAGGRVFFAVLASTANLTELWAVDVAPGVVSVGDLIVSEGDAASTATFAVRLNAPSPTPVRVGYVTVAGSAQAGSDFVPRSGTLTFPPGTTELTLDVEVVGDLRDEADESFTLELAPVRGTTIADGRAVAIVLDDDASSARLGPGPSVAEGDSGTTDVLLGITLTTRDGQPTVIPTTVGFSTADGTTAGSSDYEVVFGGTVTFPAGTPSGATSNIPVRIVGDVYDETDEFFTVGLDPSGSASVDGTRVRVTILDDDGVAAGPLVELAHGSSLRATFAAPPGGGDERDFYVLQQDRYGSYEAVIDEVGGSALPVVLERLDHSGVWAEQIASAVGTGSSVSLSWNNVWFTPYPLPVNQRLRVRSGGCTSACSPNDTYRIRFYDTTLRSPRFSNKGTQRTSVILQNASADPVQGLLILWDDSGAWLEDLPFAIVPFGTFAVDTAGREPGRSGSLTVVHDGRYGSLTGKAITVDPATGATFESPISAKPR
jgi:ELWxxDGT repeat protein